MNKVVLIGRLTRDVELRYTESQTPVATFTLAVNRNYTNQSGEKEADFINIVVWRKPAENCKNYLSKGSQVAIEGRMQTRNYDDKDGKKVYITEVIAESVEFLNTKTSENVNKAPVEKTDGEILRDVVNDVDPYADFGKSIEITDKELPF